MAWSPARDDVHPHPRALLGARAVTALLWALAAAGCASDGPTRGGSCQSNRDCAAGEACVAGTCAASKRPGCTRDDDCPLDQICDTAKGACGPLGDAVDAGSAGADAAASDAEAPPSDTGVELPPDASAPDDSGVVVSPDAGAPADTGVVVPPADAGVPSDSGLPPDGGVPADSGVPPDAGAPVCTLDADCGNAALICVNSTCVSRCDRPAGACTGANVCNAATGRCVPGGLTLGTACTLDAQCTSGFCLGLTVGGTSYDLCSDPCSAGSNCPLGFTCTSVSGMNFCLGAALFGSPAPNFNTPAGGACSASTNTCQTGWCNTGTSQCIETCSRTGDCASWGGNCYAYEQTGTSGTTWDNICYTPSSGSANGAACTANSGCRSGLCNRYTSVCAHQCCSEADCASNESCAVYDLDATTPMKICVPRSNPAGPGAIGALCTTTSDCESETCVPVDPSAPNSLRRCSTLCCRNADCSVLPGAVCRPFGGAIANTLVGACQPAN